MDVGYIAGSPGSGAAGWVTVDVKKVVEVVKRHGFLKILDDRDLVVECEREDDYRALEAALRENFGDQADLEPMGGK